MHIIAHTHTHTHTHIYIYIYMRCLSTLSIADVNDQCVFKRPKCILTHTRSPEGTRARTCSDASRHAAAIDEALVKSRARDEAGPSISARNGRRPARVKSN